MADENKSLVSLGFPSLMSIAAGDLAEGEQTAVQTRGPWSLEEESVDGRSEPGDSSGGGFDSSEGSRDSLLDLPDLPELPDPTGHTAPLAAARKLQKQSEKLEQPSQPIPVDKLAGKQVIGGRYAVEARIGEGGMGRVYRVRHLGLGKTFALKIIRTVLADDEGARKAFFREARLASGLSHPTIVSIVDFGEDPSYGVYMVMELLEGEPLRKVLREKGRFAIRPACEVMLQVADAIRYVHEKGIIHCDIKAENILLGQEKAEGGRRQHKVKLLDFGLARPSQTGLTSSVSIQGTPAYIAPERIKGMAPAPSMDIYALGILFYELLTGAPPWTGALHLVLASHVNEKPKALSEVLGEPIDEQVEALVQKTLAKEPEERQKSVSAFIYELRTTMEMLGFGTRRRSRSRPAPKPRNDIVEATFADCPLPLAAFSGDGTILVGNKAFSMFLYRDALDLRGVDLRETPMGRACPSITHDIRTVMYEGRAVQVPLSTVGSDGKPVNLVMWLTPGPEDTEHVYCAIHLVGPAAPV